MTRGSEPGYRRQPKVYKLVFADHPGLVVRARSATIAQFLEVTGLNGQELTLEVVERMFTLFAEQLVSWNLEDEDGTPIPATYEGMIGEDADFVMMIITSWQDAVAGVSAPLVQPSTSGSPSLVESLPMETLSPSLAS